jgi:hypothetical protein
VNIPPVPTPLVPAPPISKLSISVKSLTSEINLELVFPGGAE